MRAVIFDLDGTLCDSAPDLHASANTMLATMDLEALPLKLVRDFIGNGVPKLVERVMLASDIQFSPGRHAELTKVFEEIYAANPIAKTQLYPGVLDVLVVLQADGCVMGVCTNKVQHISIRVLEGLKIDGYFGSVIGGDSLPTHKPDPAMMHACISELRAKNAIYVGDSEVDAATAVAAKLPFILFSEGYRKSPVCDIQHDARFQDFSSLPEIIAGIFANK